MGGVIVCLLLLFFAGSAEAQFICPTARTSPNDTLPEWTQARPAQFAAFIDSNYATCFKKISNAASGEEYAPIYSQNQAFNSDGTKLLLKDGQILHVNSWVLFKTFPHNANGARWSPIDPNVIFYIDNSGSDAKWMSRNIVTDVETTHRNFTEYPGGLNITRSWHELSADGRHVALMGYKGSFEVDSNADIFVYDIIANRKGTVIPGVASPADCGGVNEMGMSPSGKWMIINWGPGQDTPSCGFGAYDTSMAYVGKAACGGGHYDFAVEPDGTEWIVFPTTGSGCSVGADGSWNNAFLAKAMLPNGRDLYKSDPTLHADKMVKLGVWSDNIGGVHISGQARWYDSAQGKVVGHPWVMASADIGSGYSSETPRVHYDNEVVRFFLDSTVGTPHIERLADTRSYPGRLLNWNAGTCASVSSYWAQPHATVSRDGTRLVWGSAWGSTDGDCRVDAYYMDISNKGFNDALVNQTVNTWVNRSPTSLKYDGTSSVGFPHNSYSGGVFAPEWGSMMLFGGGDHGERLGNDVWMYDTAANKWHQWTLPDSHANYPVIAPHTLRSFRSYVGQPYPVNDSRYLTHTKGSTGQWYQVADPLVPVLTWGPLGTTWNNKPWSSHSYDQLAWNSRDRKMLYWGPNFCTGVCETGIPADSAMSASAFYFGTKSAHLFDPHSRSWENFDGNKAPDLYHQTGSTAYDPVRKVMLALNRSRWASTGGGQDEGPGGGRSGFAARQDSLGVWTAAQSPPDGGGSHTWRNATLTYVKSTGTIYTFYGGLMYEYNVTSNTWSQVPTNPDLTYGVPPTPSSPYTVYDAKSNKLLVRGIREGASAIFVPTWTFDITTRRWQKMNPPTEPGGDLDRNWFAPLVYDPINNVFFMTRRGGSGAAGNGDTAVIGGSIGELWSYKLSSGSGAGVARLAAAEPPVVPDPCSSNP